MNLSFSSLLEWTNLFIRDPRMAAQMVKAANLPTEVSVLMIVAAGIVSTVVSGAYILALGNPDIIFPVSETEAIRFERSSPLVQGFIAIFTGLGLSVAIAYIGARMGGQGSLADILSITAVLQMVITVILVAQTVLGLALPLLGLILMVLSIYVFIRGLGHAVNVGHGFDNMGKSVWVIFLSFMALVAVVMLGSALGLGPKGELIPLPLGETL